MNSTKLYKNQKLTITLQTGRDLTAASTMTMLVLDPDGYSTYVSVTITNTTLGYIQSTFAASALNKAGEWTFKAYEADDEIKGSNFKIYLYEEWEA